MPGQHEMTPVELVYAPAMARYRFGPGHPMQPERFTLAVELARAWGLVQSAEPAGARPQPSADGGAAAEMGRARLVAPRPATDAELELIHTADYIAHVKAVSQNPRTARFSHGIGPGDTPAAHGLHDAAALAVGGTIEALEAVLSGRVTRSFNPAGGLHHAHRDKASGFCIYNDVAVAIERAIRARPGLRVAYVDIDAHHGDGVEDAFYDRADVLTVSVHESGDYLFPGTGHTSDRGRGKGEGAALNVPLGPGAGDAELLAALEDHVAPAVAAFAPDVIVAQLGADSHVGDPLTHLRVSTDGFVTAVRRIVRLADGVCHGRLACTGGGGYQPFDAVPVMWASALAVLLDREVPPDVPQEWRELSRRAADALRSGKPLEW